MRYLTTDAELIEAVTGYKDEHGVFFEPTINEDSYTFSVKYAPPPSYYTQQVNAYLYNRYAHCQRVIDVLEQFKVYNRQNKIEKICMCE